MRDTRQARKNTGNRIAFGILVIIVSLFCFLCEVRAFAGVGRMVYGFLVGFFGLAAYAYSIMGIIAGVCITFGVRPKLRFSRGLLYFGMLLVAVFALHVYTSSAHILGAKYGEYLMRCYDNTNTMGGMLFGVVAFPLMKAVTTIGALVVAVAAFFALTFLAILPSLKRNVVYTAYSKEERQREARRPRLQRRQRTFVEKGEAPRHIEAASSPAITDFSRPSGSGQNLYVVNVDGDPLQTNKKAKGADGYRPLYPNAMGGYEDERRTSVRPSYAGEGIYSPQNLARNVLFARDEAEAQENLRRFNTVSNPNSALNSFGGPSASSTSRRSDLRQRLGIDDSANTFREEYLSRYNLREDVAAPPTTAPQVEEKPEEPKKDKPFDLKADFAALREEQIKSFGSMYAKPEFESTAYENPSDEETVEAENIKKEVVKPTRTRSDIEGNPTVQKAEDAVEKQVNVGLQGALNRTLGGEETPVERPQKVEMTADAYEESSAYEEAPIEKVMGVVPSSQPEQPRQSIKDLEASGYRNQPTKIPRAFEATKVEQTTMPSYEMGEMPAPRTFAFEDNGARGGEVPSAPAPVRQEVTGGNMSRSAIQQATDISRTGARDKEKSEMDARIRNIKQAIKEAPPIGEFEREAMLREEKMRASEERGMKKTERMARDLEKMPSQPPRVIQPNMDQAIEQAKEEEKPHRPYVAPSLSLIAPPAAEIDQGEDYDAKKDRIVSTLALFGIKGEVFDILVGPTFTMYKLRVEMPKGKTINYMCSLENDIAMKIQAAAVRIIAPIPGEDAVGIEVPNKKPRTVNLSEVIGSQAYLKEPSPATLALGVNLYGTPRFVDVKKLPHALVAGSTGAGKSCCINSMIISLLYKSSPDDVRLILIDPKRVELSVYAGIPHLLMDEVICDTDKAIRALNWAIAEMERRIKFLQQVGFQNIDDYNESCAKSGLKKIPRIIIIVDEFADLMSTGKKAVEDTVNRIARLARAAGIHLILATQRPSVDVISGTIKNNFPSRMAFKVTASFDSKTMLDTVGAEKLLGYGDMLFMLSGKPLERMQGAFISNAEIKAVIDFVKSHNDSYFDNNIKDQIFKEAEPEKSNAKSGGSSDDGEKTPPELFKALEIGIQLREENNAPISVSLMQRKLGLGWPKAARIYDMMEERGYLSPDEKDPKKKKVNLTYTELEELKLAEGVGEDGGEQ
ncbi:MAG: hypothetical protein J5713_03125 [Clostridia bacterium]|nr:hypothetical protein [Clostridia bacterium]